jgi:hypothetical protein
LLEWKVKVNPSADDLRLVPAELLRKEWHLKPDNRMADGTLWRVEAIEVRTPKILPLIDLRQLLDDAGRRPPIAVPWRKSG